MLTPQNFVPKHIKWKLRRMKGKEPELSFPHRHSPVLVRTRGMKFQPVTLDRTPIIYSAKYTDKCFKTHFHCIQNETS